MNKMIQIENISKVFRTTEVETVALNHVNLEVKEGEFVAIMGPSGCGKSTLLNILGLLDNPTEGSYRLLGEEVAGLKEKERTGVRKGKLGFVFQSFNLIDELNVFENVELPLTYLGIKSSERRRMVEDILKRMNISHRAKHFPQQLSGGQQQRVALARAVVVQPQVLLMDEPLSNLDAKLRLEMRTVISRLQRELGITTVYVTHDQEEALAISDRIAVMNKGDIYHLDAPERIYSRPYNTFVANFIGSSTMIDGTVTSTGETTTIKTSNGLEIAMNNMVPTEVGREVIVGVRPEEFVITSEGRGAKGTVKVKQFLGKHIKYEVAFSDGSEAEVSSDTNTAERIYDYGETIYLNVNARRINVFDKQTKITLIKGVHSNV